MTLEPAEPRVVRRRLPPAVRREQLLDVAERLFVAKGFSAVSMEDIARAAGVTRPIVYHHFGTREGAYLACVQRARAAYDAQVVAAFDEEAGPEELLERGAQVFFGILEDEPARWRLLFGSSAVLAGEHDVALGSLRFGTVAAIEHVLRRHARDDVDDRTLQSFAHAMSGVAERLAHWWLSEPTMTKQELVAHYVRFCWAGLAPHLAPERAAPAPAEDYSTVNVADRSAAEESPA